MAVLPDADRVLAWQAFVRDNIASWGSLTKDDLRAAVNALDDFLNTNAAAINNAIPQPARAQLTTAQKARLLVFVVERRYLSGV